MNIYIKLETKTRDLEGRLLLGIHAALDGNEVFIGDDELLKLVENKKLNPGIILEKSITPAQSRIAQLKNYKLTKTVVTSLDEEGGLLDDKIENFLNSRMSKETISMTDKVFFWGNFDFESTNKLFSDFKEKFIKSGNPRVELWGKKYKSIYENKDIKNKKCILISSNFGVGVSSNRFSDIVKSHIKSFYFVDADYEKYFYKYHSYKFEILTNFIIAINHLTSKFNEYNFVVRPHPDESMDIWKCFLNPKKNLIITKDYSHSEWIENSEIIIHNGCMGGVEAFAREKKIVCYKPIESDVEMYLPNNMSLKATKIEELEEIISSHFKNVNKIEIKNKNEMDLILTHRFGNFDKESFCTNILNEWNKMNNNYISRKNNLFKIKFKNKLRFLKNFFINPNDSGYKFPRFNKEELDKIFSKIKKCDKKYDKVSYELIGPKLFKLKLNK